MKKRSILLAALLAAAALTGAAFAAGGDSADPLISLDYLQSVFSAKVDAAADSRLDASDRSAYAKAEDAWRAALAAAEANAGAQRADVGDQPVRADNHLHLAADLPRHGD